MLFVPEERCLAEDREDPHANVFAVAKLGGGEELRDGTLVRLDDLK